MNASIVLIAVALGAVAVVGGQPPPPDLVAIRAPRLLNTLSGQIRGPVVVVVSGRHIERIEPASEFDEKSVRTVIDLGNATVLPGLIDAHVHLQIGGSPADNAMAALRAGFTTLIDLGATSDVVLRLRDGIKGGTVEGPTIVAAGLWVGTKNGICEFGGIGVEGDPAAFGMRVRENAAMGADLIKVCVSGWAATAFAQPDTYEIKDEALAAVVAESRLQRRAVIAHAISLGGARAAARAGVLGLAHAAYLDAATAAELKKRQVFVIPTLQTLTATPGPASEALKASVMTAHRAGVPLVFGTDGGVLPHGQNATEFQVLVDAGLSPIDAIRTSTVNAAKIFDHKGPLGSLSDGDVADIIAVDGDPVRDIGAMSRVTFVMHDGRIVRAPGPVKASSAPPRGSTRTAR